MSLEEEGVKPSKTMKSIDKEKEESNQLQNVEAYREAFSKIEAATNITDIKVLVPMFIVAEEQNFKMFKFVNSQADEIEYLDKQIEEMKLELKKYSGKNVLVSDDKRRELKELEERLSKTELRAEQFDLEYQQSLKKISSIKS